MDRIILVDDHPVIRLALRTVLEREYNILAETANGEGAISLALEQEPDLLLLGLEDFSGLDAIAALKDKGLLTKVLIMSGQASDKVILQCMQAGAIGFFDKKSNVEDLCRGVRMILSGYAFFPAELLHQTRHMSGKAQFTPPQLSKRECQVMQKLLSGHSNKEIADTLFLSNKTISTHKARLLQKLDLKTVSDLFVYAKKNGMLRSESADSQTAKASWIGRM